MKKHEIEIESREYSKLAELAPRFREITRAYYSGTPAGHTTRHEQRYWWLLGNEPHSKVYFARVNGTPIACALVLKKSSRWYSLPVHEESLKQEIADAETRARVLNQALSELADRIINENPRAWGTVGSGEWRRINFFTRRHWQLAQTEQQVVNQFRELEPAIFYSPDKFKFERVAGRRPHVKFMRSTSINGPKYEQVLLLPKK